MTEKKKPEHEDDPIMKALNFQPFPSKRDIPLPAPVTNTEVAVIEKDEVERDFAYSRENMMHLIENGRNALEELVEIAKSSQHPRAFEVIATMIKTLADTNKDLLELQKKKKELRENVIVQQNSSTVNNLYVGSTKEFQKIYMNLQREKSEEDPPDVDV